MSSINWITSAGFLFTSTELVNISVPIIASGTNVSYKIISGSLPDGLSLSTTGTIFGIPQPVINISQNKFVVRAFNSTTLADRTFSINVEGRDFPLWNTYLITTSTTTGTLTTSTIQGYIGLGINGSPYVLNNQWIDFQFSALPQESPANTLLKYYIADGDGELPSGIRLDQNGRIYGYIKYYTDAIISTSSYYSTVTTYLPKIYEFKVTATDGVVQKKQVFKILALDPNMFRADATGFGSGINILDLSIVPSSVSYLQPLQFLNNSDLGIIRSENNEDISIRAYDPAPLVGTVTYTLVTGTSLVTNLPQNLKLDSNSGYIYGYIPYQPSYTRNYELTIKADKRDGNQVISSTNTFTLEVKGLINREFKWISDSNLGSIFPGEISELKVEAYHSIPQYNIRYQQINGTLPNGLILLSDGCISGSVEYNTSGTYTFEIEANDIYRESSIRKEFSINVLNESKKYTKIYMQPLLLREKREAYSNFINNEYTFDSELIYRPFDINFGIQRNLKIILEFGIEQTELSKYSEALTENFYRKKFYFGNIKIAIAKDSNGNSLYDLVYADVVDQLVNFQNTSVNSVVYINNKDYYPSTIDNMRKRLESIVLDNLSVISVNNNHQPKFMNTAQPGEYQPLGYIKFIPICYALPGQGHKIVNRIKNTGFEFKMINFDIDRLLIESNQDYLGPQYLIFPKNSITG